MYLAYTSGLKNIPDKQQGSFTAIEQEFAQEARTHE